MPYYLNPRHKRTPLLVASCILLSGAPAFAQLGQSDLIAPDASSAPLSSIEEPQMQAPPAYQPSSNPNFMNGVNPGTGWSPPTSPQSQMTKPYSRFQKPQPVQTAPVNSAPMQQGAWNPPIDQSGGDNLNTMGWSDNSAPAQSQPVQSQGLGQSGWQAPQQAPAQTMPSNSAYNTGFSAGNAQTPNLDGYVSASGQSNFTPQPFTPGTAGGGMDMNGGTSGMNSGMGGMGMSGLNSPMGGTGTMNGMAGMNSGMGGMGAGMGGMGAGMGGMDAMGGMGALMGGMGAAGMGSGNPLDNLGKMIGAAAQMGLIPSSGQEGTAMTRGGSSVGGMSGGNAVFSSKTKKPGIKLSSIPGVKLANTINKSTQRAVNRNINYATNSIVRRGIRKAVWGW